MARRLIRHDDRRRDLLGRALGGLPGYSRAIVVGDDCWVSGTTDAGPDGQSRHPGDIGARRAPSSRSSARRSREGGFALADVVRTRMFVTDIAHSSDVLQVHREIFGSIRPAATMVEVSALIEPYGAHRDRGGRRRG